jgi:hypothetical protein
MKIKYQIVDGVRVPASVAAAIRNPNVPIVMWPESETGCITPMANQRDKDKQLISCWVPSEVVRCLDAEKARRALTNRSDLILEKLTDGRLKAEPKKEKPAKKPAPKRTQSNRS